MCSIIENGPAARGEFACAQAGCLACQDALIREHNGLIHAVLQRVAHPGVAYDELVQVGRQALWRAILGYDAARGWQFSTYSWRAIERAVWDAVDREQRPQGYLCPATVDEGRLSDNLRVQRALRAAVQQLPARLQAVLTAVYGLDGQPPCSRAALGREWGLSRERIRQLHNQAVACLQHPGQHAELYALCARDTRAGYQRGLQQQRRWQRGQRR